MLLYNFFKSMNEEETNRILIAMLNLQSHHLGDNRGSYVDLHDGDIVFTLKNITPSIQEAFRAHENYSYDYEDEWNNKLVYVVYEVPSKYKHLLNTKDPSEAFSHIITDTQQFWCKNARDL